MISVCHNLRRYANRVFKGIATGGEGFAHLFENLDIFFTKASYPELG